MKRSIKAMTAAVLLAAVQSVQAETRPLNILLITTDDQGREAGCYGDALAITPNLDRLAAEGVLFENGYVTHASCSPSRSSILTGLHPHQNGHIGLAGAHPEYRLKAGVPTLPALLKQAGYLNGIIGKLHIAPRDPFPFDFEWASHGNPLLTRDVREVARQAGLFLGQAAGRPFFLYVNYFDPHRPFDAGANQSKGLPEKPYGPDDIEPLAYLGLDGQAVRKEVAAYYNGIRRMDTGLGLLFGELEKAGVYQDTLVIFLGDHGAPFTRAKTTSYEAGLAVPFVVRWPGVGRAGLRSRDFVSSVDIVPTVLDAVGAECPPVAGRSLRGVVRGETPPDWRTLLFADYTSHDKNHFYPRRSVRGGQFKLIHNLDPGRANPVPYIGETRIRPGVRVDPRMKAAYETTEHPPEWELYDLSKDPHECSNLAANPEYAATLQKLQAALRRWREETQDPLLDPAELARLKDSHGL